MATQIEHIKKDRNFFLTFFIYLDIMIQVVISFTYLVYIINNHSFFINYPAQCLIFPALGALYILFLVKILKWNKDGFWGVIAISVISLLVNLSIKELEVSGSFIILATPVILYLIMQIKKNGVSAWTHIYISEDSNSKKISIMKETNTENKNTSNIMSQINKHNIISILLLIPWAINSASYPNLYGVVLRLVILIFMFFILTGLITFISSLFKKKLSFNKTFYIVCYVMASSFFIANFDKVFNFLFSIM